MQKPLKLSSFVPPVLADVLLRLGIAGNKYKYGFKSWEHAQASCSGYDDQVIFQSVVESSRRARDGKAVFDRDGVTFDKAQYSWPLLTAILGTPRSGNLLNVLDWGGALGSTYRQSKPVIDAADLQLNWVVVEQPRLAAMGKSEFENAELSFVDSLHGLAAKQFDLAIFSSSICYVEKPAHAISEVVGLAPSRIVFDRTPESPSKSTLIGVQKVGRKIYRASYPVWAFAPGALAEMLGPKYSLSFEWVSEFQPDPQTVAKGYCFDRTE